MEKIPWNIELVSLQSANATILCCCRSFTTIVNKPNYLSGRYSSHDSSVENENMLQIKSTQFLFYWSHFILKTNRLNVCSACVSFSLSASFTLHASSLMDSLLLLVFFLHAANKFKCMKFKFRKMKKGLRNNFGHTRNTKSALKLYS